MIGAILGDMIGAPYEFDRGNKTKEFPLFAPDSEFTDDSVMTIAVAEALMDTLEDARREGSSEAGVDGKAVCREMEPDEKTVCREKEAADGKIKAAVTAAMQRWGKRYPDAGYGGMFYQWLRQTDPQPYGSFGNGSAMRAAAAGWLYSSLEETLHAASLTAEVTHNHPEGVKGAQAVAAAIYLARTGSSKEEIRDYIIREFGYDLSRTCDEIRPGYRHNETCQKTVPEAITAFLEGKDFEDVIRTAVSLGGDCDTLTCIAGSMAEAFYGVPEEMAAEGLRRLPEDMQQVYRRFDDFRRPGEQGI